MVRKDEGRTGHMPPADRLGFSLSYCTEFTQIAKVSMHGSHAVFKKTFRSRGGGGLHSGQRQEELDSRPAWLQSEFEFDWAVKDLA